PIQPLEAGTSSTASSTAASADGSASQLVTVTINGPNSFPARRSSDLGAVTEDVNVAAGNISASGALSIADVDAGQSNFAAQAGTMGRNGYGTSTPVGNGMATYSRNEIQQLGAGHSITDSFTAVSSDGR